MEVFVLSVVINKFFFVDSAVETVVCRPDFQSGPVTAFLLLGMKSQAIDILAFVPHQVKVNRHYVFRCG